MVCERTMKKQMIVSIIVIGFFLSTAPLSIGEETVEGTSSETDESLLYLPCDDSSLLPEFAPEELIVKFKDNLEISMSMSSEGVMTTDVASVDALNSEFSVSSAEKLLQDDSVPSLSNVYRFSISEDVDVLAAVVDYSNDSSVEFAEPNYIYHLCVPQNSDGSLRLVNPSIPINIPNDPYFEQQWALHNTGQMYPWDGWHNPPPGTPDCDIDAPEAWDIETGDDDVVVAILDSGVDYNHPDLASNIWINEEEDRNHNGRFDKRPWWLGGDLDRKDNDGNGFVDDVVGWDFGGEFGLGVFDNNDPMDPNGHGTHCAGIVSAVGNNGIGISGVCWNCKIMPVKVTNSVPLLGLNISFYFGFNAARSIIYAVDNGADVISMSLGGGSSSLFKNAVDYAYSQGVVLVAGVGNEGTGERFYPAAWDNVIAVAATDSNDERPEFSNYGSWVDVAAPGVDILSLRANDTDMYGEGNHIVDEYYYIMSGTSIATPHASGLAALLLSKNQCPNPPSMVKTIMLHTLDEVDSDEYIGGRINAYEAIKRKPAIAVLDDFPECTDIKGRIDIRGWAWSESGNLQSYTVKYGKGSSPDSWTELIYSTLPVEDSVLASWDTETDVDGLYTVGLTVVCNDGVYNDTIQIVVNNLANTYHVDDDNIMGPWDGTLEHPYRHIRDAVNDAGNGDEVYVYNGTYYDENVLICKSISLIGENKDTTVIEGGFNYDNDGDVIKIIQNGGVDITGFTIQGIKCIYVDSSNNHISGNNIINHSKLGIKLSLLSKNNVIYHNNFITRYVLDDFHAVDFGRNTWYNTTLREGNYWHDYEERYPDAKPRLLRPWIWDTPHNIKPRPFCNKDRYPLIEPYESSQNNNQNSRQPSSQPSSPTSAPSSSPTNR